MAHPDLFCPSALPMADDVLSGLLANVQEDRVAQDMMRAALYAA